MSDLISRQEAIDAIHNLYAIHGSEGSWIDQKDAFRAILNLPSAQPELCEDAVSRNAIIQKLNTMDRYVSEELILCDTDKKFPKNEVFIVDDVYEEIVENLPSAQPEIIQCKECKHFEYDYIENVNGIPLIVAHEICMRWCEGVKTSENGYCFLAERKDNE